MKSNITALVHACCGNSDGMCHDSHVTAGRRGAPDAEGISCYLDPKLDRFRDMLYLKFSAIEKALSLAKVWQASVRGYHSYVIRLGHQAQPCGRLVT